MATNPQHIVALGRAYVRLIEAAQLIANYSEPDDEVERLQQLAKQYQAGLRQLLATVSSEVAAEILAASDKVLGPVQDHGLN